MLPVRQVPKGVAAEIEERDLVGGGAAGEIARSLCHKHLTAVPSGHDTRGAMNIDARVVGAAQHGLANVDADSDTELHAIRPGVPGQRPLRGHGCIDRLADRWEDRKDRVAFGGDEGPAVAADRLVQQRELVVQHRGKRVAKPRDQASRALDVSYQERDRACGQILHRLQRNSASSDGRRPPDTMT